MFSLININWKGQSLSSYEIVVNLIGSTINELGLRIKYVLDEWEYEPEITVSDEDFTMINIKKDE